MAQPCLKPLPAVSNARPPQWFRVSVQFPSDTAPAISEFPGLPASRTPMMSCAVPAWAGPAQPPGVGEVWLVAQDHEPVG